MARGERRRGRRGRRAEPRRRGRGARRSARMTSPRCSPSLEAAAHVSARASLPTSNYFCTSGSNLLSASPSGRSKNFSPSHDSPSRFHGTPCRPRVLEMGLLSPDGGAYNSTVPPSDLPTSHLYSFPGRSYPSPWIQAPVHIKCVSTVQTSPPEGQAAQPISVFIQEVSNRQLKPNISKH